MNTTLHFASKQSARSGFSLIELLIALSIMAIVSAIAIPLYTNYVISGKIPMATSGLASEQVQMEQFFQDNQTYLIPATPPTPNPCTSGGNATSNQYFTFSCTANTATTYTLDAKGVTGSPMAGFEYSLDQSGNRLTVTVPSARWGTNGTTCWIIKAGGQC